ncbi:unnamed protein product, partial [Heterotrigona itama]
MLKNLTLEKAINIIRLSLAPTFCWPLRASNNKSVIFGYRVMQICAAVNISLLLLPTLYTTYLRSDVEIVSFCVTQAIGEVQSIVQTIICFSKVMQICTAVNISLLLLPTLYKTYLRSDVEIVSICVTQAIGEVQSIHIIEELWSFIEGAQRYERDILHEYFARVNVLYGGYIVAIGAVEFHRGGTTIREGYSSRVFCEGQRALHRLHRSYYPFDVNNRTLVSAIIRVQQIIACHQVCAHECMCLFGALLIWFTAARFECLMVELQSTADIRMLAPYIKKHLRLI